MEFKKSLKREIKDLERTEKITILITIIGMIALILSVVTLAGTEYFQTITILSIMLIGLPYTFYRYWKYRRIRQIEKYLPDYLRDVSEAINSGLTLPKALETSTKGSYGALSEEMEKTANQISWGVPFEEAMEKFIERNDSYLAKKAITVIIESHRSGGDIAKALKTVAGDIKSIERMKKQRESKLRVYTISIYLIFFLFLGIIAALTVSFIPATPDLNQAAEVVGGTPTDLSPQDFQTYFFHLSLVQGFFAGLIAGQMGEGSILSGVKHSVILVIITTILFQFFLAPPPFTRSISEEITVIAPGAVDEESGQAVYTIGEDVTTEEIAEKVREIAAEEDIDPLRNIESEDIIFVQMNCEPCRENKLDVTAEKIEVRESSSVGARVKAMPENQYQIIIGESPDAQAAGSPVG